MGWLLVDFIKVTSEKQPSQALNQPLILIISPGVVRMTKILLSPTNQLKSRESVYQKTLIN